LAQAKQGTRLDVAGHTDVGRVRTNNEDSFGLDSTHGIFVVCDGMGGHAAGEVASQMAVQSTIASFASHRIPNADLCGLLFDAVTEANRSVYVAAHSQESRHGMGTTLVALVAEFPNACIVNVGDSRGYLLRAGELRQVTNDHSLVMEQVRRGVLTLEEARRSSVQNIILRALGSEPEVEIETHELELQQGDTLLLTTDGLCRHVPDEQIAQILLEASNSEESSTALIHAAKSAGGEDNITCVVIRVN
jgi:protein phosphatase